MRPCGPWPACRPGALGVAAPGEGIRALSQSGRLPDGPTEPSGSVVQPCGRRVCQASSMPVRGIVVDLRRAHAGDGARPVARVAIVAPGLEALDSFLLHRLGSLALFLRRGDDGLLLGAGGRELVGAKLGLLRIRPVAVALGSLLVAAP